MSALSVATRPDGVAVVTFDTPDSPVNVLSRELLAEFATVIDAIEADPSVRACVLASAKPDTFIAGADLKQITAMEGDDGEHFSRNGQRLLDRIASGKRPWVAAIHGAVLGGGLEVALACHFRVASDDPNTVLALPEVQLGLLPAGGGTQRLPRLIGVAAAVPLMLTGKRVRAPRAEKLGLVDALTSPGGIVETAARAANTLADGHRPGKPKGTRRRPLSSRLLDTRVGRALALRRAASQVQAKTRGLYPAPPAILECVRVGLERGMKNGLEREAVHFGKLTASPEAKSLISIFLGMTDLKKPDRGPEPSAVKRLGILGGGFMGAGIASVSLSRVPVTVKDISEDVLAQCARTVDDGLRRRVRSRAITRFERDRLLARLHLTTRPEDLAAADLVIEAVFEDLDLKHRVLAEAEKVLAPEAVFASNTSALPIADIAAKARHPERVLGMHYFSPVPLMPLLELIRTEATSDRAVATARAFAIRQGKTVIVVRDGPCFYTTRILSPLLAEAIALVEEGARVQDVDRAAKNFGFPVGPLALLDEVGIDVAVHVTEGFGKLYAGRGLAGSDALSRMFAAGYSGRKNRRGFYLYPEGGGKKRRGKQVNDDVYRFFPPGARKTIPAGEIASRLALLMVNEAFYCLEEGIIACPRDGDIGAVLGLGFPPFRGGPFRYVDASGPATIRDTMERLKDRLGPRFEPAPMLRDRNGATS